MAWIQAASSVGFLMRDMKLSVSLPMSGSKKTLTQSKLKLSKLEHPRWSLAIFVENLLKSSASVLSSAMLNTKEDSRSLFSRDKTDY